MRRQCTRVLSVREDRRAVNFVALRWLSLDGEELNGGGACVRESFILKSTQQEEALHHIRFSMSDVF
ncbi:unnamed protein product [Spirodela intermedia]|uniref:Uncharacterized protein n=1 Tax=Spirodela intermedia TaxID=51605 RepID=A0A7I8LIM6_SPIIN|nr:unnamed protein product [Spirodela intermedia]